MKNYKQTFSILFLIGILLFYQSVYSQSAIGQLETMTGQKINRGNSSSSSYDINMMVTGMVVQSMLSSVFNSNGSIQSVHQATTSPAMLSVQIIGEQQKVQMKLAQDKYNKMMASYKLLDDSHGLKYKPISEVGMKIKTLDGDLETKKKQSEFDFTNTSWLETQKKNFKERTEKPNKWANEIYNSLKTNTPPLPYKKFDELESGDVILFDPNDIAGKGVKLTDQILSGSQVSDASHTVTYLKEEKGKKIFLDNMPGEGPKIISEDELLKKYVDRDAQVAKLSNYGVAQPLNEEEANKLYEAAKELEAKNIANKVDKEGNLFDNTNYGTIGKDNLVCSEASWFLIKSTGRELPLSKSWATRATGVDFSPADFYDNTQYFVVTPLSMPK